MYFFCLPTDINQNLGCAYFTNYCFFSFYFRYTLRNAEYRLCLERNFDLCEDKLEKQTPENGKVDLQGMLLESANIIKFPAKDKFSSNAGEVTEDSLENIDIQGLGEVSPEAQQYILQLQAHLSSAKKVLNSFIWNLSW